MKRIEYFEMLTNLFRFKTIFDEKKNEYVVFKQSHLSKVSSNIIDKTEFEALENHIHLLYNIKPEEFKRLIPVAKKLCEALLCSLECHYPKKHFIVYVSISLYDSMIIRFHQKWENEESYFNVSEFTSCKEKVFCKEN